MSIIAIDAGHGGGDENGAVYGSAHEDEIALNIAYFADFFLREAGHDVILTRETDTYVALSSRVRIAEYQNADFFISIHCNANENPAYHGMDVHVKKDPSTADYNLARHVERVMQLMFPGHRHRGIKKSNYHVLRENRRPAILVETEFLSNVVEREEFLIKVENQNRLGKCIAEGAMRYIANSMGE